MANPEVFTISDTSPAAASTAIGDVVAGLARFDEFMIDADLIGATGGALDVYLQREVTAGVWRDWVHFPQLASGAAAVKYSLGVGRSNTIVAVGLGDANTATPALAANTSVGGHPGNRIRAVYVAGASTSAGAAVTIRVSGWTRQR